MSTGKLKAATNRVRTSFSLICARSAVFHSFRNIKRPRIDQLHCIALQANSMWTNTIGVQRDPQHGSNAVVEASLRAPQLGGGGRKAKREAARQLIMAAGLEGQLPDYEGLINLARKQGKVDNEPRGACKVCGGLGHLSKQCKNQLSQYFSKDGKGPGLALVNEDDLDLQDIDIGLIEEIQSQIDAANLERENSERRKKHKKSKKHKKHKLQSKELSQETDIQDSELDSQINKKRKYQSDSDINSQSTQDRRHKKKQKKKHRKQ